jgi:hypothetical protein
MIMIFKKAISVLSKKSKFKCFQYALIAFFSLAIVPQTSFAQWNQLGIDIDGDTAGDLSGVSISMPDSNTIAIGAIGNDSAGVDAGQVRIFRWTGTAWVKKGNDLYGEAAGDNFGRSVSMPDSNTIAVGADLNDGTGVDAGHVRVFSWTGNAWVQKGGDIDGEAAGDWSGWSVSMPNPDFIAIGAKQNAVNGQNSGHVRIYRWTGSAWVQKGTDIDSEAGNDWFGHSVSMPDTFTVAIGAPLNDGNGSESGHVRVYRWSGSNWVQKGSDLDGEAAFDNSGWSVSMPQNDVLAIGARFNSGNGFRSGHVRVYEWSGTAWVQKGVDIDGPGVTDRFGIAVSMSDSNTMAIGAINKPGSGTQTGHVRVYEWTNNAWTQKGGIMDGEAAADEAGSAVSMPNANTVAFGALFNDGNGPDAGHVRVFRYSITSALDENTKEQKLSFYPNPVKDNLIIESNASTRGIIQIIDLKGKVIKEIQLTSKRELIDLSQLSNGMYFVKFEDQSQKLMIAR